MKPQLVIWLSSLLACLLTHLLGLVVGWLVGQLIACLLTCLVEWLASWLVGRLPAWFACSLGRSLFSLLACLFFLVCFAYLFWIDLLGWLARLARLNTRNSTKRRLCFWYSTYLLWFGLNCLCLWFYLVYLLVLLWFGLVGLVACLDFICFTVLGLLCFAMQRYAMGEFLGFTWPGLAWVC